MHNTELGLKFLNRKSIHDCKTKTNQQIKYNKGAKQITCKLTHCWGLSMSICYVSGKVKGAEDPAINRTDQSRCPEADGLQCLRSSVGKPNVIAVSKPNA